MIQFRSLSAVAAVVVAMAFSLCSTLAAAQSQSKEQQRCINTMNKGAAKVAATQGKGNSSCVKNAGKGKLSGTAQACLSADAKGKVAKAQAKVVAGETKKCAAALPDFGFTDSTTINSATVARELEVVADLFGASLDAAIIDAGADKTGAGCQAAVIKSAEKYGATFVKAFVRCKKAGLKGATITSASGIESCVGSDPKSKVAKASTKVKAAVDKKCESVTLASAFPASCSTATASNQTFADCVSAAVACNMCEMLSDVDGVDAPCDQADNGVLDGSCPQCGNSIVDSGEECDEGGVATVNCEAGCTFARCGDGIVNALRGEECDDGNSDPGDGCTNSCTICGDGVVTAPESCDDGNLIDGDGCCSSCGCRPSDCAIGCQDPLCPNKGEILIYAGTTGISCTTNGDCVVGTCDTGLSRCVTVTGLDTGWTGIAHKSDINDQVLALGNLICEGPGPICGQCVVSGVDPASGDCRCANDNRAICDQPFEADADDCGGAICDCYFGDPLPLSSGNVPVCVVNRFAQDVSGTANIDLGSGVISAQLKSLAHLGENIVAPCPVCGGTCTAPPANVGNTCGLDRDCETSPGSGDGVCGNLDTTAGDGLREGTCWRGLNDGQSCDIGVRNETFAAPGGTGHSLDCFPDVGKNVSGTGLSIDLTTTTGAVSLPAVVDCGIPVVAPAVCPCGLCDDGAGGFSAVPCTSNADCTQVIGGGTCGNPNGMKPNECSDGICTDVGGGNGECLANALDNFCDGITRANGEGLIACLSNADCGVDAIAIDAGACTLTSVRPCFLDPVGVSGVADPNFPVGVSAFCIPPTASSGINVVVGLPGPGRVVNATSATTTCTDGVTTYTPGVGGCP